MKKAISLTPEQEQTLESFRRALDSPPDRKERIKFKKRADELRQFGRVRAIAGELLPTLSLHELRELGRLIRRAIAKRPTTSRAAHRPRRSQEDQARETQTARAFHDFLTTGLGLSSAKADTAVGMMMFADPRSAQRKRSTPSDKKSRKK